MNVDFSGKPPIHQLRWGFSLKYTEYTDGNRCLLYVESCNSLLFIAAHFNSKYWCQNSGTLVFGMLITPENRKYLLLVWTSVLSCLPLLGGEASDWLRGYNISSFPSPGLFPASSSEAKERNCSRKINYLWWCKTATLKLREGGRERGYLNVISFPAAYWEHLATTAAPWQCTTCHVSRVQCSVFAWCPQSQDHWSRQNHSDEMKVTWEIKLQELQINLAHFSASLSSPHCLESGSWLGPGLVDALTRK